jgi:hypothetical protein
MGRSALLSWVFLKPIVPPVHIPDNDVLMKAKNWVKLSSHRPRIVNSTNSDVGEKILVLTIPAPGLGLGNITTCVCE